MAAPETEVFYTFTWARNRAGASRGREQRRDGAGDGKPRGQGKPRGKSQLRNRGRYPGQKAGQGRGDKPQQGAKTFQARPPRHEKPIDPDNPFAAALMGLKDSK